VAKLSDGGARCTPEAAFVPGAPLVPGVPLGAGFAAGVCFVPAVPFFLGVAFAPPGGPLEFFKISFCCLGFFSAAVSVTGMMSAGVVVSDGGGVST
jgi:hypothetical protein